MADERQIYQPALAAPAGKYVFRAAVQKKVDAGVMYLFANGRKTPVLTGNTLRRYEVSCEVNEGDTLDVGVMSGAGNATQWVSIADAELMYYSPLALLKEALSEAGGLDYGEDADGALSAAVAAARGVVTSGDAASRMSAYHTLREAMDAYKKENASLQHPYDVTSSVANATFDGRNVAGWELAVTDKNFPAYNRGVIEFWHTPFDLNQTLSGLQNGVYRVGMQARSDKGAGNTGFMLYAVGGGVTEEALAADKTPCRRYEHFASSRTECRRTGPESGFVAHISDCERDRRYAYARSTLHGQRYLVRAERFHVRVCGQPAG